MLSLFLTETIEERVQFIGSVLTSICLVLQVEACDLLHPRPHMSFIVLLELVLQLFPLHRLLRKKQHISDISF